MNHCCDIFKNTYKYIQGYSINYCPKCGNSLIDLATTNEHPILNSNETYHIRCEKISTFDDEFREYVRENILPYCKVADGVYKYQGELLNSHDEGVRIAQIINMCDWNKISGYSRKV